MQWSLQKSLFALLGVALIAGLVPAGLVLDRRVASEIEERARDDLAPAPSLMVDREHMAADALMMHAKDLSGVDGLAAAFAGGRDRVATVLGEIPLAAGESPLAVGPDGTVWLGVNPGAALVEAARTGGNPAAIVMADAQLWRVSVAPVMRGGEWLGAVGVAAALDRATAGVLAGLMRSEVVLLAQSDASDSLSVVASTTSDKLTAAVARAARQWRHDTTVRELHSASGGRHLLVFAPLGQVAWAAFARDLDTELQVVPELRRTAAFAALFALGMALILGSILAAVLTRPVRALSHAAERLSAGDFDAQLERSSVVEVNRLAQAFADMRSALAARLQDLEAANEELAEKQRRLKTLQAELIQRDRLAASGRLVAELAHEIRNPVANVRNCLEVVRRRVETDDASLEFVELAIGEILRMHELAERVLDLNRPRDPSIRQCDAAAVAREVAALSRVGSENGVDLQVETSGEVRAAIAPDALKQVLLSITQNAREAMQNKGRIGVCVGQENGRVLLEIADEGPGIPDDVLPHVFDAFFTTKAAVRGVGLGLFVAEGIVSSYGGRISATNGVNGGAVFRIDLPAAFVEGSDDAASHARVDST